MRRVSLALIAGSVALLCGSAWAQSSGNQCDLNQSGTVNVSDVQLAVNMYSGAAPCTATLAGTGVCNKDVVDRVKTAALGGPCVTGQGPHSVSLSWLASTSTNVSGYNVYRSTTSGGPYTKLNSSLLSTTAYTDINIDAGDTYYYIATAVNSSNQESAYSNQATAVVPTP